LFDVIQQPFHFGSGEIAGNRKPGNFGNFGRVGDMIRDIGGPCIVPHNGIMVRSTRGSIPRQSGFALIGDAYGRHGIARQFTDLTFFEGPRYGRDTSGRVLPQYRTIVFVPSRTRVQLLMLQLRNGTDPTGLRKNDEASTRRPLINGTHELGIFAYKIFLQNLHKDV
jgi:hypothetical protein